MRALGCRSIHARNFSDKKRDFRSVLPWHCQHREMSRLGNAQPSFRPAILRGSNSSHTQQTEYAMRSKAKCSTWTSASPSVPASNNQTSVARREFATAGKTGYQSQNQMQHFYSFTPQNRRIDVLVVVRQFCSPSAALFDVT
jgi:hypothetical protein